MPSGLRWTLGAVAGIAALWIGAFAVDNAMASGEVLRNTEVARRPVGGMGEQALRHELEALAADFAELPVTLIAPNRGFRGTASEWGVSMDVEATLDMAMASGRDEVLSRLASWTSGFVSSHNVDPVLVVDAAVVADEIASRPASVWQRPVEPSFQWGDGAIDVRDGSDGQALSPEAVTAVLREAVAAGVVPDEIEISWSLVPPTLDAGDVASALDDAAALTDAPIPIRINGRSTVIPPETARRWVESTTETGSLQATFNETATRTDLAIRLTGLATTQEPPVFSIVDEQVVIELDDPIMICCEAPVAALVEQAARTGEIAELTARQRDPDGGRAVAEAFGITQLVGEFTTNHSCCQSRVNNIQRMADIGVGREVWRLWGIHADEILHLVDTNARVATVWHRSGLPILVQHLIRLAGDPTRRMPSMIDGEPIVRCVERFTDELARHAGSDLRRDLAGLGPIPDLAGCTYDEVVVRLEVA